MSLPQPQEEAVRFYAPMFLLYGVYDGAENKRAVLSLMDDLMENARSRLKERIRESRQFQQGEP